MNTVGSALGIFLLAAPASAQSQDLPPDPQALLAAAEEELQQGNLDGAGEALARLHDLLVADPAWDPNGIFDERLLPALHARLERVRDAAAEIDVTLRNMQRLEVPPMLDPDRGIEKTYGPWIAATVDRLHAARSQISEALSGTEQAILMRTEPYLRSQEFLEKDLAFLLAESLEESYGRMLEADERARILRDRLESLKRDTVAGATERARLLAELAAEQTRAHDCASIFIALLAGPPRKLPVAVDDAAPDGVADAFVRLVHRRLGEVQGWADQTQGERLLRLDEVERFRRMNQAGVRLGILPDQSPAIEALQVAVEHLPLKSGERHAAADGWLTCCFSHCLR